MSKTDEDNVRQERSDDEKRRVLDDWHRTKSCDMDTVPILIDALQDRANAAEARLQKIAGIILALDGRAVSEGGAAAPKVITMPELSEIYTLASLDRPVVEPLLEEAPDMLHLALLAADNCLTNLEWLEEATGETLEIEDRAVLKANFADLKYARFFLAKLDEALKP